MEENIELVREYLYPEGVLISKRIQAMNFKKRFPVLFARIEGEFFTDSLYSMLFPEVQHICLGCGSNTRLRSFTKGWMKTCSKKCLGKAQSKSDDFANKIRTTKISNFGDSYYEKKYGITLERKVTDGSATFIVKNYCPKSPFELDSNLLKRKIETGRALCEMCTCGKYETSSNITKIDQIDKNLRFRITNESWLKNNYPLLHKEILSWSNHIEDLPFKLRCMMFSKKIKNIPICEVCNEIPIKVNPKLKIFNKTCGRECCILSSSSFEIKIREYISSKYEGEIKLNYRIDNTELDIFLPGLKLGIECNGVYWHSEAIKTDPNYHLNKVKFFESNGIMIFQIWEDQWINQRELILSMIDSRLNLSQTKIYARKCKIVELSHAEYQDFLSKNHIQGRCWTKIKYGLMYNEKLVSVMGFGDTRKILGTRPVVGNWELLRYCNSINTNVIGGAGKLLSHFIKNNKANHILSYANRDFSSGNLYRKLGFTLISSTQPNYTWLINGVRYSRLDFQKHKISDETNKHLTEAEIMYDRGATRVFDSGSLKYELQLNKKPL